MSRKKHSDNTVDELDAEYAAMEVSETPTMQIEKPEDMLSLIEQPAWKTILISLVKSEKMDPWNIDILVLAQKYLEKIRSLTTTDLRLPANAMLASAILLKFKARALRLSSIEEDALELRELLTEEQLLGGMMPELISPRMSREGKVTLDMLVESIEAILERTKSKVQRERENRDRPVFNLPFAKMNIEGKMQEMLSLVEKHVDSTGLARFSTMMHQRSAHDIIEYFLALLFLVNDGKVNAWQNDLFGEIFVSTTMTSGSDTVLPKP